MAGYKQIPFVDFSRVHAPLKAELMERIGRVIDEGSFVLGDDVRRFETNFARFLGVPSAVGVSSGLDALKLALQSLGVGPGDEVIVPAHTFIATAFAVSHVGAKPVLVDVEPDTCNIDVRQIERSISPKTRAIMVVHLYGQSADMQPILDLAKKHSLYVIEDTAQAHGATYNLQLCGTLGTVGCFSFYPTKNLGAMGEGGAVVTRDKALAERIMALRNVGQKEKNDHLFIGHNARLHSIQAAVLDVKLTHLLGHNQSRQRAADLYRKYLGSSSAIKLPQTGANRDHIYHLYVVQTQSFAEREALKQHLQECKVGTAVHYPVPIHLQKCYESLALGPGSFPVAEHLAKTILSLPMFPEMHEDEIAAVASAINDFYLPKAAGL